jgi:hypothetical protein
LDVLQGKIVMKELYGVATVTAALIATIPLLGGSPNVVAAESAPPTGIKNVVLVHGAFADGSGWEAVAKILQKDGSSMRRSAHSDESAVLLSLSDTLMAEPSSRTPAWTAA